MVNIFIENFFKFDGVIFIAFFINIGIFVFTKTKTNKLYNHFISPSKLNNIRKSAKKNIESNTVQERKLSENELIEGRTSMNRAYALYLNVTSAFPLLGMLGTVISLLGMVNVIEIGATNNFFSALTSTLWGIIAAIIFKLMDSALSYKIETIEICMNHMLNPNSLDKDGE